MWRRNLRGLRQTKECASLPTETVLHASGGIPRPHASLLVLPSYLVRLPINIPSFHISKTLKMKSTSGGAVTSETWLPLHYYYHLLSYTISKIKLSLSLSTSFMYCRSWISQPLRHIQPPALDCIHHVIIIIRSPAIIIVRFTSHIDVLVSLCPSIGVVVGRIGLEWILGGGGSKR